MSRGREPRYLSISIEIVECLFSGSAWAWILEYSTTWSLQHWIVTQIRVSSTNGVVVVVHPVVMCASSHVGVTGLDHPANPTAPTITTHRVLRPESHCTWWWVPCASRIGVGIVPWNSFGIAGPEWYHKWPRWVVGWMDRVRILVVSSNDIAPSTGPLLFGKINSTYSFLGKFQFCRFLLLLLLMVAIIVSIYDVNRTDGWAPPTLDSDISAATTTLYSVPWLMHRHWIRLHLLLSRHDQRHGTIHRPSPIHGAVVSSYRVSNAFGFLWKHRYSNHLQPFV